MNSKTRRRDKAINMYEINIHKLNESSRHRQRQKKHQVVAQWGGGKEEGSETYGAYSILSWIFWGSDRSLVLSFVRSVGRSVDRSTRRYSYSRATRWGPPTAGPAQRQELI